MVPAWDHCVPFTQMVVFVDEGIFFILEKGNLIVDFDVIGECIAFTNSDLEMFITDI